MAKRLDLHWLFFSCLFDWVVTAVLYQNLLFRCLPGKGFHDSLAFLWSLSAVFILAGSSVFGVWLGKNNERTALLIVLCPYGLYTFLAYDHTFPFLFRTFFCGALVLGVLYTAMRLFQTKRQGCSLRIWKKRCCFCFYFFFCLLSAGMAGSMLVLGVRGVFMNSLVSNSVPAQVSATRVERDLSSQQEVISLLNEENWEQLDIQDKLEVLQVVVNIESAHLGLPTKLTASCSNLDEHVLATYSEAQQMVSFDLSHLEEDTAAEVLNSCIHEVRHAYQYCLVNVYCSADPAYRNLIIFDGVSDLVEDFSNYQENGYDYYDQCCEYDARLYAEDTVYLYKIFLQSY